VPVLTIPVGSAGLAYVNTRLKRNIAAGEMPDAASFGNVLEFFIGMSVRGVQAFAWKEFQLRREHAGRAGGRRKLSVEKAPVQNFFVRF
jgi:hypothetical protein